MYKITKIFLYSRGKKLEMPPKYGTLNEARAYIEKELAYEQEQYPNAIFEHKIDTLDFHEEWHTKRYIYALDKIE